MALTSEVAAVSVIAPRRCRMRLAATLASLACALGGLGSPASAVPAPGSHTAADGASAAAVAAGDLARFAVDAPAMVQAELIAVKFWNTSPCGGAISVNWAPMDAALNGASNWWNPVAAYGNASANSDCRITLNQNLDFDWPMFCTVMVHEIGHLVGQQHSTDQNSVMYPTYIKAIPECQGTPDGAAAPALVARTAATKATAAGTHKAQSHHKKTKRHAKKKHA